MSEIASVDWSRAQFALTAIYHFLFVPLTLGLSFIIAIMESIVHRRTDVRHRTGPARRRGRPLQQLQGHGRGQGDADLPLEQRSDLPHDAQGQVRLDREHHDLSLRGGTGVVRYQGDPIRLEMALSWTTVLKSI